MTKHVPELAYRRDIDGLRGIAILLVVLYHANAGVPGGFVGVDVFFVISGFLITHLIRRDLAQGRFKLGEFWARRIRRLLPALALTVAGTLIAGYWLCWLDEYEDLGASTLAQQAIGSNLYFWRTSGYFAAEAEWKPMLHTWSLAIEEQFYLLFPAALMWLAPRGQRSTWLLMGLLALASFLLCVLPLPVSPGAIFFLLPARGWELLLGCLLAWTGHRLPGPTPMRTVAAATGLLAVAIAAFSYDHRTNFPGTAALLPTLGAALVLYAGSGATNPISRLLSTRLLVWLGLISYSLYLLHWPVLSLATNYLFERPSTRTGLLLISMSCIAAWAMWRWVEQPLRKPDGPLRGNRAWWALGLSTGFIACLAAGIWLSRGVPARFAPPVLEALETSKDVPRGRNHAPGDLAAGRLHVAGAPDSEQLCLLWGDSHAEHLAPGMDAACRALELGLVQATYPATPPVQSIVFRQPWGLAEKGPAFAEEVLSWAAQRKPVVVVAAANWEFYVSLPGFEDHLRATCERLRAVGARVVLLRDTPRFPVPVPLAAARALARGGDIHAIVVARAEHDLQTRGHTEAITRAVAGKALIEDPATWFEDGSGQLRAVVGPQIMFHDIRHLSRTGSLSLAPQMQRLLATALGLGSGQARESDQQDQGTPKKAPAGGR